MRSILASAHRLAGVAAFAACTMGSAHAAVVFNYPSFANNCGNSLTCVGNTNETGGRLRLTNSSPSAQNGAAYSTTAISLGVNATFSTQFQFQISNPGGIAPADGFTFVLAAAAGGLGSVGQGIGYAGVPNSVAIEFDTYNNGGGDGNSSNHVGVDTNGNLNSAALANPYGKVTCDFSGNNYLANGCMSNGHIWTVVINYDGALLDVIMQDGNGAVITVINDYAINIAATLGTTTAFVGFTSATAAGYANHDILNWTLANDASITVPTGTVPEPGSLLLAGLALLGVGLTRRATR